MKTLALRKSIGRSPLRLGFLIVPLMVGCFALSSMAQLVPAPDGGYPGQNTAEGENALFNLTTGVGNTAIGFQALFNNTTGEQNTALGKDALRDNTTGSVNTATGFNALQSNTEGGGNTATGSSALIANTAGSGNTATGFNVLSTNTTGSFNTANGANALVSNTTGQDNTATGWQALFSNQTGNRNTATGFNALLLNTEGRDNTATGYGALLANTIGFYNTALGTGALGNSKEANFNCAVGSFALGANTTGDGNTAIGFNALLRNTSGGSNTALGRAALMDATGGNNIAVGFGAGLNLTTGSNNIDIGNDGVAADVNTIRIGTQGTQKTTFIAGISGTALGTGVAVRVNANGQLGSTSSSARFKQNIKPMDKASEAILALKPVTFHYKKELDPEGIPQFGLVAEEVEKVNPDLVARDADGKVYTVNYDAVNAMLLNEFLKEHRTVQELKTTVTKQEAIIAQQQKGMEALVARLKELDSKIEKVNAQLEANKSALQMVANDQ